MSDREAPVSRRALLAGAAAALAGVTLAPGIRLIEVAHSAEPGKPVSSKVRWGLLIDAGRCVEGCRRVCWLAAGGENDDIRLELHGRVAHHPADIQPGQARHHPVD